MAKFWIEDNCLYASNLVPGFLGDAIDKWLFIYHLALEGILVDNGGDATCSLCLKHSAGPIVCGDCPVKAITGCLQCCNTPYGDYCQAYWDDDIEDGLEAASAMVALLRSLP